MLLLWHQGLVVKFLLKRYKEKHFHNAGLFDSLQFVTASTIV